MIYKSLMPCAEQQTKMYGKNVQDKVKSSDDYVAYSINAVHTLRWSERERRL